MRGAIVAVALVALVAGAVADDSASAPAPEPEDRLETLEEFIVASGALKKVVPFLALTEFIKDKPDAPKDEVFVNAVPVVDAVFDTCKPTTLETCPMDEDREDAPTGAQAVFGFTEHMTNCMSENWAKFPRACQGATMDAVVYASEHREELRALVKGGRVHMPEGMGPRGKHGKHGGMPFGGKHGGKHGEHMQRLRTACHEDAEKFCPEELAAVKAMAHREFDGPPPPPMDEPPMPPMPEDGEGEGEENDGVNGEDGVDVEEPAEPEPQPEPATDPVDADTEEAEADSAEVAEADAEADSDAAETAEDEGEGRRLKHGKKNKKHHKREKKHGEKKKHGRKEGHKKMKRHHGEREGRHHGKGKGEGRHHGRGLLSFIPRALRHHGGAEGGRPGPDGKPFGKGGKRGKHGKHGRGRGSSSSSSSSSSGSSGSEGEDGPFGPPMRGPPEVQELAQCMREHKDEVSDVCSSAMSDFHDAMAARGYGGPDAFMDEDGYDGRHGGRHGHYRHHRHHGAGGLIVIGLVVLATCCICRRCHKRRQARARAIRNGYLQTADSNADDSQEPPAAQGVVVGTVVTTASAPAAVATAQPVQGVVAPAGVQNVPVGLAVATAGGAQQQYVTAIPVPAPLPQQ